MKFFRFDIGARATQASRFIGGVRNELLKALTEEKQNGVTQQELAEKLKVPRSELNSQLAGNSGLTLRAISDLAWALGRDITFELKPREAKPGQNSVAETSTMSGNTLTVVGAMAHSSTLPSRPQVRIISRATAK
ncbi:helix-turn-helix transcriptional regulator [Bosea sp. 124]|uniref:helix-turn-helix domain-containing protein n=1 Tax=Bosea sp. 124 TaxID=2135642 RepID=UPI000D3CB361|nr:helix-turn-helix transcriptional regulator [Bosea sp. 124]PTM41484.1 hypothetical protein C8D03_3028 [Bosea sp. 124]